MASPQLLRAAVNSVVLPGDAFSPVQQKSEGGDAGDGRSHSKIGAGLTQDQVTCVHLCGLS